MNDFATNYGTNTMCASDKATETLDPEDWEQFRRLCHEQLDECVNFLRDVEQRPVWRPFPQEHKSALSEPPPFSGTSLEETCRDVRRMILPYPTGNIHPSFFGWVHGTGTPVGLIAEMFRAAMNSNVGGREHSAVYVERQIIEWFREIFGFPAGTSGLLVTGTSMATIIGLAVARFAKSPWDVNELGLQAEQADELTLYTSRQAHGSVSKALELLGCGRRSLRFVKESPDGSMDADDLHHQIEEDLCQRRRPFCVVATVGSAGTGAVDDLMAISAVCRSHNVWLHVDGAFGALAVLAPDKRHLVEGIDRADSLAFDFHKWLHVPYDTGCILVRDGAAHLATFASEQSYLRSEKEGLASGAPWFCDFGPELSRGFRALSVWMVIKHRGLAQLGQLISRNCAQADYLARRVSQQPRLELLAKSPLNIVCFRFVSRDLSDEQLDMLNRRIVIELQMRGIVALSTTTVGRAVAMRACITNHRTGDRHLDLVTEQATAIGGELLLRYGK